MESKGRRLSKQCVLCLVLCWSTLTVSQTVPCSEEAKYLVSVTCLWTPETHPIDYPTIFPHFSPMCGTVHNKDYSMWQIDGISTDGIKDIAETGSCSAFRQEVAECEEEQNCKGGTFSWFCNGDEDTDCMFSGSISVSEQYSHVSMLSMLAPSPDWIVGLDSVDLCEFDEQEQEKFWKTQWPQQGTFPLYAIDAGTDGGERYLSTDKALATREPIAFFSAMNNTNTFYNPDQEMMLPICELSITLDA